MAKKRIATSYHELQCDTDKCGSWMWAFNFSIKFIRHIPFGFVENSVSLCVSVCMWAKLVKLLFCIHIQVRAQRSKHTKNETFDQARVKLVVNFPFEQQKKCIIHRYSTTFFKYDRLKIVYRHKSNKIFAFAFNIIRFGFVFITNGGPSLPFLSHS